MGKVPANAVFLHRGVIRLDPHTNLMLAGTHWNYLRQAALHGVGGNQAKSLFCGTGDFTRIGEVAIHPDQELRVVEAVLQLQVQAGILCSQRGMHRHEQGGDQEQPKYNPSLDRYTCGPLACVLAEQRRLGAKLCYVFPV
jgi:hypothetical protein